MLLHVGAFHLDIDSHRSSPWHTLAPRTRVLCALLIVFACVLTPNGHWWTWAIYGAALISLVFTSQVTLPVLCKRIAVEFVFIGVVLLGTLFREGGSVLWAWGPFQVTTHGLVVLGSVTLKALLSLVILNLLTLTTSIPALLNALVELRVPPLLVAIMASMYRYIAVLVAELHAMRRAAAARNFSGNHYWQRQVIGNMMGSLFIRTYARGDRVYQAMLSRGYQGLPTVEKVTQGRRRDVIALSVTLILALLGQSIYLL